MGQINGIVLKRACSAVARGTSVLVKTFCSIAHIISISVGAMQLWASKQRKFSYDCFVRRSEWITAFQLEFRRRFEIHRNDSVPSSYTILRWADLRSIGSQMKTKPPGTPRKVRTPENVKKSTPLCSNVFCGTSMRK
ncbi:hypothetical protein AVEN_158616-1 [Araneus ventricosus]|uniref:DUF4817 domain-containing protein n=1 Tax=Araneus ventricosus TaxID=182803 RepID=A0A4Y2I816_ARAVE|nr:hypothetical protein AVEN_158616-1 [Araneus ventricosus]